VADPVVQDGLAPSEALEPRAPVLVPVARSASLDAKGLLQRQPLPHGRVVQVRRDTKAGLASVPTLHGRLALTAIGARRGVSQSTSTSRWTTRSETSSCSRRCRAIRLATVSDRWRPPVQP